MSSLVGDATMSSLVGDVTKMLAYDMSPVKIINATLVSDGAS